MVDKYHKDIEKLKTYLKELDEKVIAKDKELQKCNAITKEKDDWMVTEEMKINLMEKQIEVYRCDRDEKRKAIDPLQRRLNNLQLTVADVSIVYYVRWTCNFFKYTNRILTYMLMSSQNKDRIFQMF